MRDSARCAAAARHWLEVMPVGAAPVPSMAAAASPMDSMLEYSTGAGRLRPATDLATAAVCSAMSEMFTPLLAALEMLSDSDASRLREMDEKFWPVIPSMVCIILGMSVPKTSRSGASAPTVSFIRSRRRSAPDFSPCPVLMSSPDSRSVPLVRAADSTATLSRLKPAHSDARNSRGATRMP